MAKVQIKLDQAGKPAGTAGIAREDLATGVKVVASAVGGPYSSYKWEILDAPINWATGTASAVGLSAPTASSTDVLPIDIAQTYLLRLSVDSGSGLGATADDVATITFYAGPTLSTNPAYLPRRKPSFGESLEHNVTSILFPSGNPKGWKETMDKWFLVVETLYAALSASALWKRDDVVAISDGQTIFDLSSQVTTLGMSNTTVAVNGLIIAKDQYGVSNFGGHGRITYTPTGDSPTIRAGWTVMVKYLKV